MAISKYIYYSIEIVFYLVIVEFFFSIPFHIFRYQKKERKRKVSNKSDERTYKKKKNILIRKSFYNLAVNVKIHILANVQLGGFNIIDKKRMSNRSSRKKGERQMISVDFT